MAALVVVVMEADDRAEEALAEASTGEAGMAEVVTAVERMVDVKAAEVKEEATVVVVRALEGMAAAAKVVGKAEVVREAAREAAWEVADMAEAAMVAVAAVVEAKAVVRAVAKVVEAREAAAMEEEAKEAKEAAVTVVAMAAEMMEVLRAVVRVGGLGEAKAEVAKRAGLGRPGARCWSQTRNCCRRGCPMSARTQRLRSACLG